MIGDNGRLKYLRFCLFEMYVNVVFVIRCLYSTDVCLIIIIILVKEQSFIRFFKFNGDDDDDDDDDDYPFFSPY